MGRRSNIITTARSQLAAVITIVVLVVAVGFMISTSGTGMIPGFLIGLIAGVGGKHMYEHQSVFPSYRTRTMNELDEYLGSLINTLSSADEGTVANKYANNLSKRRRLGRLQTLNNWIDSPNLDPSTGSDNVSSVLESSAVSGPEAQESQNELNGSGRAHLLAAGLGGHSVDDVVPESGDSGNDETLPVESSQIIDLLKFALEDYSDRGWSELRKFLRKMGDQSSSNLENDLDTIERRLREYQKARQKIESIYYSENNTLAETTPSHGQQQMSTSHDRSNEPLYVAVRDYRSACKELGVVPIGTDDQPLTSKIRSELQKSEEIEQLRRQLEDLLEAIRTLTDEPPDWTTPVDENSPLKTLRAGIEDGWIGYKTVSVAAQEVDPSGKYSQELITPLRNPDPDDKQMIRTRLEKTGRRLSSYATIEDRLTIVDKVNLEQQLDLIRERLHRDANISETNMAETHLDVITDRIQQADALNEVEMFAYAEALDAFEKAIDLTDSPGDYDELLADAEESQERMDRELEDRPHGIRNGKNVLYPFAEVGDELMSDAKDAATAGEMGRAKAAAKAAERVYDTVAGVIDDPETRKLLK